MTVRGTSISAELGNPRPKQRKSALLVAMLGATALTAPIAATPALAQESQAAAADNSVIIVTAQRRDQALEDVPMTVTVISQESLDRVGVDTIRDLTNVTSGFQLNNSGSYPQPAIRGVTTTNSGSYENNVALFVDGLYQITPQILNMDLPNVNSIQILKGPQGTLYGRNATGGAILIDTLDPGEEWEGMAEVGYGRFDDKRARAYVAGPLSHKVGISLAGTYRKNDGYYKRASVTQPLTATDGYALGKELYSFRAKLKFDLTDTFRATLGYNHTRADDPTGVFFTPNENTATPYPLGVVAGNFFDLDLKLNEGSLKLELDTGLGTLRSITGYSESSLLTNFDSGGTYTPDRLSASKLISDTWQTSLDYNIDAIDRLNLIIGGTFFQNKEKYGIPNSSYIAGPNATIDSGVEDYILASENFSLRKKEAWAAFIDATFEVTDQLSITVGGRYSEEKQNTSASMIEYCTAAAGCAGGVAFGGVTAMPYTNAVLAKKYSKFTPRAAITYEITPRTSIYASYTKGFKAGETNSVIPAKNVATWDELGEIGQESVDSYEVGLKHSGRRFRFDLSGFYYDYKNLQISSVQFVNGVASVLLQNLPSAEIYGAEASFDYEVLENFNIRAGATWLHARYGDRAVYIGTGVADFALTDAFEDPLKNNLNRAFPFGGFPGPMAQDISGMQMARAPDFSGYVGFDYTIPNGDGGLTFAANAKYTDSYVVTDASIWGGEVLSAYNARLLADPNALPDNFSSLTGTPYENRSEEQRARPSRPSRPRSCWRH